MGTIGLLSMMEWEHFQSERAKIFAIGTLKNVNHA